MTDNRIVWVALAGVFGIASLAAVLRWPQTVTRTPLRWTAPLVVLLLVLGVLFVDAVRERAASDYSPQTSVTASLERDPRLVLWERIRDKIEARPWIGYGFGRRVLAQRLSSELGDPLLAHAHNAFASQWLQTGAIGLAFFVALLAALAARYARFARSRDDTLAFVGVVGIALLTGFLIKNLTDDFLFRSNAKEFWALSAMLLGYGTRRASALRAGHVTPQAAVATEAQDLSARAVTARTPVELVDQ